MNPRKFFLDHIINTLVEHIPELKEHNLDYYSLFTRPPQAQMGDFALPCFHFSKILKQSPMVIAQNIVEIFSNDEKMERVEEVSGYVNFTLKNKAKVDSVASWIYDFKNHDSTQKKILIEYSSPNPCKTFHVGHVRNTVLGSSIINLYKYFGNEIQSVNYLNDTGTHVAKVMWLYLNKYKGQEPQEKKGEWLGNLYVEANILLKEDESKKDEVAKIHRSLEDGDTQLRDLLEQFKEWSQESFDEIYQELQASFDIYMYDSTYIHSGKEIVNELVEKGVAHKSDGAIVVDLEEYGLHTALILKSDGAAVYITKDFSMAKDRFEKYGVDELIYVVGSEQNLHFKQLFKILELYGFENAKNCYHASYELVNYADGTKMSSRGGSVILYRDIMNQAFEKAKSEILKRNTTWDLALVDDVSQKVAMAAIKFTMLKYDTQKKIDFDIDAALDLQGDTGPYVLYTMARIQSLLAKVQFDKQYVDESLFESPSEKALMSQLLYLENSIEHAYKNKKPSAIAHAAIETCQIFNSFYQNNKIIFEDEEHKRYMHSRLYLTDLTLASLKRAMELLNIEWVESM